MGKISNALKPESDWSIIIEALSEVLNNEISGFYRRVIKKKQHVLPEQSDLQDLSS
jgi:hypothetical protein